MSEIITNLKEDLYNGKVDEVAAATQKALDEGISAGEIINIIGMAIQQRVAITELETLQMATHPYLTSAPTMYPLVLAAQDVNNI